MMKRIPPEVIDVIDRLDVDLLVLNEYADGDGREPFKDALRQIGYNNILVSRKIGRSNQVLISSTDELDMGEIFAPDFDGSSRTNFLHILMPAVELNIVGLRCPAYKLRRDLKTYWEELRPIIDMAAAKPIVFVGDFNGDPDGKKSSAGTQLAELRSSGWRVPAPEGE